MINHFTDLHSWQEAHKLVLLIYKLTSGMPSEERFALSDQLKRAAVSVSSNIAEGFARNGSKEKIHFYSMSRGSLFEIESQLQIVKDLKYGTEKEVSEIQDKIILVSKMISGMIKSAPDK